MRGRGTDQAKFTGPSTPEDAWPSELKRFGQARCMIGRLAQAVREHAGRVVRW
jgi:hypothetical protein